MRTRASVLASIALISSLCACSTLQRDNIYLNPEGIKDASDFYTHVVITHPGRVVYLAGQIGTDESGKIVSSNKAEQMRQAFKNLRTAILASGGRPDNVAKIQVFSVNHTEDDLAVLSEESLKLFTRESLPASTLVPVPRLALDGLLFEIEATLVIP